MRHLRLDYEAIQPWPTKRDHFVRVDGRVAEDRIGTHGDPIIPDDEPVFILRAKDLAGPETVRLWAQEASDCGADRGLCARVAEWADEMEAWAMANGGQKIPDVPPGLLRPWS